MNFSFFDKIKKLENFRSGLRVIENSFPRLILKHQTFILANRHFITQLKEIQNIK